MKTNQKKVAYIAVRMLEVMFVAAFVLGVAWNGTTILNLTVPQFLMLYGAIGAGTCEVSAQGLKKSGLGEEDE